MAITVKQMASVVSIFGALSFILGVVAENKKPAAGLPIPSKGGVICKYPSDPTVVLGYLSVAFLVGSTVAGYMSLFYPYKGKSIPQGVLFQHGTFMVFFNIAL
ncbi:putative transmembrane protein [Senna tora]|uniref:Putative transmembrane protein n=1 Tax=Senna tora TaxID=362788 RepID=A0A834U0S9_9FABA|nr:putative transmembrane protein [Senna tora]